MNTISLRQISYNHIGQWSFPLKCFLNLGLTLIILWYGYERTLRESLEYCSQLKKQELVLREEFKCKQSKVRNINQYQEQISLLETQLSNKMSAFPETNNLSSLLKEITDLGVYSGLQFDLFAPLSEIKQDFYQELPIKMSVTGTYLQIANFLNQIAELKRLVTLHDLILQNKSQGGNKELILHLTAKIYRVGS